MADWAWLNGQFVPKNEPLIPLEDRGFTFGDGLFEVMRTVSGKLVFFDDHYGRLAKSARELSLPLPFSAETVRVAALELVSRNGVVDGEVYLQLTRGRDVHREHRYPPPGTSPTFFMLAFPLRAIDPEVWRTGARVFTYPDLRHGLCGHKTLNLMGNVMAKNHAYARGGYEALMYREREHVRYVTEGGSSSYFCVREGRVLTPEVDNLLPGITRGKVLRLARGLGLEIAEAPLAVAHLLGAEEVFLASTVSKVMPVRSVDETEFRAPGDVTARLMDGYATLWDQEVALH